MKDRIKFPLASLAALVASLIAAQAIGYLIVYLSNLQLFHVFSQIIKAGYVSSPNALILPTFLKFSSAFGGAVFFTFTTGAGVIVASMAMAFLYVRAFNRDKIFLGVSCALLVILLIALNLKGLIWLESIYVAIVAALPFYIYVRLAPKKVAKRGRWNYVAFIAPIIILAICWTTQFDTNLFIRMRDYLLLDNPVGQAVNDGYYRYTLYPAEVFKPLEFKTIKGVAIQISATPEQLASLKAALAAEDYLPVTLDASPHLIVTGDVGKLNFRALGKTRKTIEMESFVKSPYETLKAVSMAADRMNVFRKLTLFGLLIGLPISLYGLLFWLVELILSFWLKIPRPAAFSAVILFIAGVAMLIPIFSAAGKAVSPDQVAMALTSPDDQVKVEALKTAAQRGIDLSTIPAYKAILQTGTTAQRYWLVQALGASRGDETYAEIVTLTNDRSPDVSRMALDALGARGKAEAIPILQKFLQNSDHWYVQWYAYGALKSLGWQQTPLN